MSNPSNTHNEQPKLRICVGASAGGHMNELLKLLQTVQNWPNEPSCYITTLEVLAGQFRSKGNVYVVGECNRQCLWNLAGVFFRSLKAMIKERPDVIVTTGSLPLAITCLCGKLLGSKIVWIDSIANIEQLSMSGRMMLPFANLFLTQWPELAQKHRKAEYAGALI